MGNINTFVKDTFALLPQVAREYAMIGGGALRAQFDGTKVKDYDLFFRCHDDFKIAFTAVELSADFERLEDAQPGAPNFRHIATGKVFNLVGFLFGTPEETVDRFDFRCCRMVAWMRDGDVLMVADSWAATDALEKRLVVSVVNGMDRTERRVQHYLNDYGYSLEPHPEPVDEIAGAPQLAPTALTRIRRYLGTKPFRPNGGHES